MTTSVVLERVLIVTLKLLTMSFELVLFLDSPVVVCLLLPTRLLCYDFFLKRSAIGM